MSAEPEISLPLTVGALQLRDIAESDLPFLQVLYRSIRRVELAQTEWTQEEKDAFCDAQFDLQDQYYRVNYPFGRFYLLERDGAPVGRLHISDGPELLALMEVSLSEDLRGQGLGTPIVQWLCDRADASARPMRLYVEPDNPAKRLYERFGFLPRELHGIYLQMWRLPQPINHD